MIEILHSSKAILKQVFRFSQDFLDIFIFLVTNLQLFEATMWKLLSAHGIKLIKMIDGFWLTFT